MIEILREIHRIEILADIRRQERNRRPDGRQPARRADVDGKSAAVILAELIEEGLVLAQPETGEVVRLSPSGENYLASLRRKKAPRPE